MSLSKSKEKSLNRVFLYSAYLLVAWSLYRFSIKLPDVIEELIIKPVIWLVPVFYLVQKEKFGIKVLGVVPKNLLQGLYFVFALGVGFALEGLLLNFVKYNGFVFAANTGEYTFIASLLISFSTAFTEEVAFRGYIFGVLEKISGNEWITNVISSLVWGLVHLPIAIGYWQMSIGGALGYVLLVVVFGFGSAFVFARTKNIYASILLHLLWTWPITLFR